MIFVYIHGFASHGDKPNDKVDMLRAEGYCVFTVNYKGERPHDDFSSLLSQISDILKKANDEVSLIGTSLGGFYAKLIAAYFGLKSIIINPSIFPEQTMKKKVGTECLNYHTGQPILVDDETVKQYVELKDMYDIFQSDSVVFLDMGDEVLDSYATQELLKDEHMVIMFSGGSHRFDNMDRAMLYINHYVNNYN